MAFEPKAGLVIRFDFLWKEEERAGHTDGRKDRPCAIIVATKAKDDGSRDVILCPITHSNPGNNETGIEIPRDMARHLKLDDERSWIKTHQVNTVNWEKDRIPYGVVPAHKGQWTFGELHKKLGQQALEQVRDNARSKGLENVRRDFDPRAEMAKYREDMKKGATTVEKYRQSKSKPGQDKDRER